MERVFLLLLRLWLSQHHVVPPPQVLFLPCVFLLVFLLLFSSSCFAFSLFLFVAWHAGDDCDQAMQAFQSVFACMTRGDCFVTLRICSARRLAVKFWRELAWFVCFCFFAFVCFSSVSWLAWEIQTNKPKQPKTGKFACPLCFSSQQN